MGQAYFDLHCDANEVAIRSRATWMPSQLSSPGNTVLPLVTTASWTPRTISWLAAGQAPTQSCCAWQAHWQQGSLHLSENMRPRCPPDLVGLGRRQDGQECRPLSTGSKQIVWTQPCRGEVEGPQQCLLTAPAQQGLGDFPAAAPNHGSRAVLVVRTLR